ncbi:MAG: hypothetical protein CMJ18_27340 [Phycisphaeraceae bacterium]|nr:hypothetical protein [Phycisphaeraceae bacterium]
MTEGRNDPSPFGSRDLRLPDELRPALRQHMADLRKRYSSALKWGDRVGFGERPALIVIDLALAWTDPNRLPFGTNVDSIVEATVRLLDAARSAGIPIFFTTSPNDAAALPGRPTKTQDKSAFNEQSLQLDPRLDRRDDEKIVYKYYASSFKGTNLSEMLCALNVDTLIVTGVSTSHCVYATCRDAAGSFRVVVGREAVGERCELFHEVNLLDIEIDIGDVLPVDEIVAYLAGLK